MAKRWSLCEIEMLQELVEKYTSVELARRLGRTRRAIDLKLAKLGLKRSAEAINSHRPDHKGPSNPNWKGGISEDNYHYKKLQQQRYPERVAARKAVYDAVRAGRLVPDSCKVCGVHTTTAHHSDYSKPLEVEWYCRKCHRELHDGKH